jgi:hypothetical protein
MAVNPVLMSLRTKVEKEDAAKGSGKPSIQTTLRPNDDFRAQPLQDRNCRENDFGFPERFDQRLG